MRAVAATAHTKTDLPLLSFAALSANLARHRRVKSLPERVRVFRYPLTTALGRTFCQGSFTSVTAPEGPCGALRVSPACSISQNAGWSIGCADPCLKRPADRAIIERGDRCFTDNPGL
jgi:hypothetical protein